MRRWIIQTRVPCLGAILLILLLAGCTLVQREEAATPIPTSVSAVEPTATLTPGPAVVETAVPSVPQPATVEPGQVEGPARNPAQNTMLSRFTTADFSGPSVCAGCHIRLRDAAGADVSMPTAWRSTMMANSGKDPVWQAKVSSEVARFPALQEVIEKKCVTCHMPMGKTQAEVNGQAVTALGDGFYDPAHPLHAAAMDGVSCTLCHQIRDVGLGEMESFSGGYTVDTSTVAPYRPLFGPYQQPVARQMQNRSGFTPAYGAHMLSAEHCATCHNLYTPYVDAQGNILGEFPEQMPYTEWLYSRFGAETTSCQSCHMPEAQGSVVISVTPGRLAPRQPFYQHFFVGGNAFMLKVLADWGADLEVTADPAHWNTTMARVTDQISQDTANLRLESLGRENGWLRAELEVTALTGHKFPTSFPSRRAWLHVTVADAAGQVFFESGKPNADGSIAGNAADTDPATFEPHYDVITQPDQVQIYEPIMGDNEGQVTYTLLRGAIYLKDNRLLPAGADKAGLPADIGVYGAARDDPSFVGGSDLVTYQVDVAGVTGPFTFSAELLYEPLSYRFVQDLLADGTPLTERFAGYYGATDRAPLRVAAIAPVQTD
jgi:hypothetical protein